LTQFFSQFSQGVPKQGVYPTTASRGHFPFEWLP